MPLRGLAKISRRTEFVQHAPATRRFSCETDPATVDDQAMGKASPLGGRKKTAEVLLDFLRLLLAS